jgi:hypothetical protein
VAGHLIKFLIFFKKKKRKKEKRNKILGAKGVAETTPNLDDLVAVN